MKLFRKDTNNCEFVYYHAVSAIAWLFQRYIKPGEGKLFLAEDAGEGQLSLLLVILDHHHGGLAWLGNHREDSG